jgi:mRNA-degrading endonuclease RelE of RelBE toxin-antitoxin system
MTSDPFRGDVLPLQGLPGQWRRRVGAWRIFFRLDFAQRLVSVSAVVCRSCTTY